MISRRATLVWCLAMYMLCFVKYSCSLTMRAESCTSGDCHKGEYFNSSLGNCRPCPDNSYMEISDHNCTACKPCTRAEQYDMTVTIRPCSPESDASIGCKAGYFMSADERDLETLCVSCTECGGQVKQECSGSSDTVCDPATPYPSSLANDHVFDMAVLIACMVLLAMIVTGIIIYVIRTPQFRRNVWSCLTDRCTSSRDDNRYEREMLFLN